MPSYKFTYKNSDEKFECEFDDTACEAHTASGIPCIYDTYLGTLFCRYHMNEILKLDIKESKYLKNEKGVFAKSRSTQNVNTPVFFKNEFICESGGEILTEQAINERYGAEIAPYVWSLDNGNFLDNACERTIICYINSNYKLEQDCNVIVYSNKNKIQLYALRDIYHDTELLTDYGDEYFDGMNTVEHYTTQL